MLDKIGISSSTPDQTDSNLISSEFEIALRRTAGVGSDDRSIERNGVHHLSIEDEMIHAARFVFGVRFQMYGPLIYC